MYLDTIITVHWTKATKCFKCNIYRSDVWIVVVKCSVLRLENLFIDTGGISLIIQGVLFYQMTIASFFNLGEKSVTGHLRSPCCCSQSNNYLNKVC